MGQIVDAQIRIDAVGNTVHGADSAVHKAEIGLEYQRFHKENLPKIVHCHYKNKRE